jgi:hypothetical protein
LGDEEVQLGFGVIDGLDGLDGVWRPVIVIVIGDVVCKRWTLEGLAGEDGADA